MFLSLVLPINVTHSQNHEALKRITAWAISATTLASIDDNAHAAIAVTRFRSMNPVAHTDFIDTTTTLAPHSAVRPVDRNGMPTFLVNRAFNLEITIASADPTETYRPISVIFQQKSDRALRIADPEGKINFAWSVTRGGTVVIQHKFLQQGDDSRYEFSSLGSAPPTG